MRLQYRYPLDPECFVYHRFLDRADDPMMVDSGRWPEFLEGFERVHGRSCERRRKYGVDNIKVEV